MLDIRALQEAERWTGPGVVSAVLIAVALVVLIGWLIYRYLQD